MEPIYALAILVILGLSTAVWTTAGLIRYLAGTPRRLRRRSGAVGHRTESGHDGGAPASSPPLPSDVAVLVAAHNEELVIAETIRSAARLVKPHQIYVASDGSSDRTAEIVRSMGANVVELFPNRGKAGALVAAIGHFRLEERYKAVMLLDADTQLAADYLETALPMLADEDVVAVAGRASTLADPAPSTWLGRVLVGYRERLYIAVQYLHKYGQAARHVNVVMIVPGFASLYRTRVLRHIDIAAKGLAIEDFNMTFEVHAKKLGRIAFHPHAAIAYTQDPDNLVDYAKQVQRWALGFWQTLRRHGVLHRGLFWPVVGFYAVELVLSSIVMLLMLPVLIMSTTALLVSEAVVVQDQSWLWLTGVLPVTVVVFGVLLPDYLLTVIAAVITRRPHYLLLGIVFPLVRVLDAFLCLKAFARAFGPHSKTNGAWASPSRRPAALDDANAEDDAVADGRRPAALGAG
ncbi:glycosyltransferase [Zafaria sp. Z1313]|uniref:glycosyltransferase n=1 Tax=Zafaria sp. Z1313 TaxID=3423202 RepID=UPI003D302E83